MKVRRTDRKDQKTGGKKRRKTREIFHGEREDIEKVSGEKIGMKIENEMAKKEGMELERTEMKAGTRKKKDKKKG